MKLVAADTVSLLYSGENTATVFHFPRGNSCTLIIDTIISRQPKRFMNVSTHIHQQNNRPYLILFF